MKRSIVLLPILSLIGAVLLVGSVANTRTVKAFDPTKAPEIQERLLDGLADFELKPSGDLAASGKLKNYTSSKKDGCGLKDANNVKVNQNCLNLTDADLQGRGQAQNETSIAIDPMNTNHMVASYNDYRRGDGNCYAALQLRRREELERHHALRWVSRAAGPFDAAPCSTGRVVATPRSRGTRRATPICRARCSTAAQPTTPNPDQSSAFFVFRSTEQQRRVRGISRHVPSSSLNDVDGRRRTVPRQAAT